MKKDTDVNAGNDSTQNTPTPRSTMSSDAQRIAIAAACGWSDMHWYETGRITPTVLLGTAPLDPMLDDRQIKMPVPDYLSDLNAMNRAEKHAAVHLMDGDQWEQYGRELEKQQPNAQKRS